MKDARAVDHFGLSLTALIGGVPAFVLTFFDVFPVLGLQTLD